MKEEFGVEPNEVSISTLIKGHCLRDDVARATQVLDGMSDKYGVAPCAYSINPIIAAHLRTNNLSAATQLLEEMSSKYDVDPDTATINTFINSYFKNGNISDANKLFEEMNDKYGVKPDIHSLNIMANHKTPSEVAQFVEDMSNNGVRPDHITLHAVVSTHIADSQLDQAEALMKEMQEKYNVKPRRSTIEKLIAANLEKGNTHKAQELLQAYKPGPAAVTLVVKALCDDKDLSTATAVFDEFVAGKLGNGRLTSDAFVSLIEAHTDAGNVDKATEIMEWMSSRYPFLYNKNRPTARGDDVNVQNTTVESKDEDNNDKEEDNEDTSSSSESDADNNDYHEDGINNDSSSSSDSDSDNDVPPENPQQSNSSTEQQKYSLF
eukprot:CAMPEP_0174257882 /NCGR_PEP_ID=MMETSP0439-20130205/6983_1 /TAXON_ID=0 /ORGANISM="Stereomyxa ramosa, Strain Chinc5" /LENGTH=378 /DNA_ID=CAMNT_0015341177 /DNA_START=643 /DNA_END=1779 /DNA_ORIENTATION=-